MRGRLLPVKMTPDEYAARGEALEDEALDHAWEVLSANCVGVLAFDDTEIDIRYVLDPANGRLIATVPVASIMAAENVLYAPELSDDALRLLLSPEQIEESSLTDRWQVYHGEPEHVRWAAYWIDSAKHGPWVLDGDALMRPNPLAGDEPALCKEFNADPPRLRTLCGRGAGVEVEKPVCVGVDPGGMHVRAPFGIVRVKFPLEANEASQAHRAASMLLG